MLRNKKWLMLGASALLLAACTGGNGTDTGTETTGTGTDTTGTGTDTGTTDPGSGDKVTLTYANWNFGTEGEANIERMMIEAYNESQDDVEVVIAENITTDDWNGSLATAASSGDLPDVFMLNSIPTAYSNQWLLDITDIATADEDYNLVNETTRNSVLINDQVVALPFALHMFGFYVNNDLLNEQNLTLPTLDMSVDEFVQSVKDATNFNEGRMGLKNATNIVDWYPGAVNEELGWFTYNMENGTYSLDSNEMIEGINIANDLGQNGYTYDNLTDEQKETMTGGDSGLAFFSGHIAYSYDGTWLNNAMAENADFDYQFIGVPGGKQVIVNDFLGISQSTEHPEEAYEFAKYMSFGIEGFTKRMELTQENDMDFNTLPMTTDQGVLDQYWSLVDVPGVREAYDQIDTAMADPFKIVPGYVQSRFEGETGVSIGDQANATVGYLIDQAVAGNVNYSDYAAQLQQFAQQAHDNAVSAMGQ